MNGMQDFDRINKNLAWYSRKSRQYQTLYKFLKLTQIIVAALIPTISALAFGGAPSKATAVATGILGMLVVIIEGLQTTFRPLEKWMLYRSTAEGLKREKFLYSEGAGPYDGVGQEGRRKLFVVRTEDLMSNEHAGWREVNRSASAVSGEQATGA
jgi:hypothetical protein